MHLIVLFLATAPSPFLWHLRSVPLKTLFLFTLVPATSVRTPKDSQGEIVVGDVAKEVTDDYLCAVIGSTESAIAAENRSGEELAEKINSAVKISSEVGEARAVTQEETAVIRDESVAVRKRSAVAIGKDLVVEDRADGAKDIKESLLHDVHKLAEAEPSGSEEIHLS